MKESRKTYTYLSSTSTAVNILLKLEAVIPVKKEESIIYPFTRKCLIILALGVLTLYVIISIVKYL